MKKITKFLSKNFLYVIMIIAIIAGAVVIAKKGFEYGIEYQDHQRLEIILDDGYENSDMNSIVKSVYSDSFILRKASLFGTTVAIDAKSFSDEQITAILDKVNEKYGTEYSLKTAKLITIIDEYELSDIDSMEEDEVNTIISEIQEEYGLEYTSEELADTDSAKVDITDIKGINILDTVKKFIIPLIIVVVLTIAYMEIRNFKYDKLIFIKVLLKVAILVGFLVAVTAIVRLPLTNLVVTGITMIGVLDLILLNVKSENAIEKNKLASKTKEIKIEDEENSDKEDNDEKEK